MQIVTFLSDIGTTSPSVAVAKAAIWSQAPGITWIDVTHQVHPSDLPQAAYILHSAWPHFAPGTVHVCAVGVFDGAEPALVLVKSDGHYFIAPDNGLLPLAFFGKLDTACQRKVLKRPISFPDWCLHAAQLAAQVVAGSLPENQETPLKVVPTMPQRKYNQDGAECNIIYVDNYGNVVLDMTRDEFHKIVGDQPFVIQLTRTKQVTKISNTYADVPEGNHLCRFNAAGFLEIAVNKEHGASYLGLGTYSADILQSQSITISITSPENRTKPAAHAGSSLHGTPHKVNDILSFHINK